MDVCNKQDQQGDIGLNCKGNFHAGATGTPPFHDMGEDMYFKDGTAYCINGVFLCHAFA
jgi:hypothetical protein